MSSRRWRDVAIIEKKVRCSVCGRYTFVETKELKKRFKVINSIEGLSPRYNVAPGQLMPVITREKENMAQLMRWGLVPFWAKDPKIGYKLINARSENLIEKPSWRRSFLTQRCLIPASGFYEWQHQNGKQPYYIHLKDEPLFAFAGLYDRWLDVEEHPLETFTIITVPANEAVGKLHTRMPAILIGKDESVWLDPNNKDAVTLQQLLQPYPSDKIITYPVSTMVNNANNEGPEMVEPVDLKIEVGS